MEADLVEDGDMGVETCGSVGVADLRERSVHAFEVMGLRLRWSLQPEDGCDDWGFDGGVWGRF